MKPGNKEKAKPRLKQRKRRRCLGAREYKNYSQEMLQLAVEFVENNRLSARAAAKQFSIPKQTILNKIHNKHNKTVGCPTRLTAEEESKIVKVLIAAAKFGCPLTKLDLRLVVFEYLKKNNRQDLFEGRPPGKAWVDNFLLRNAADLTVRITQNIKTARAEKGVDEFMTYFENLRETIKDVPPSNIMNFDETNLSDNPGNSKCIFKRGVKYPERILNSTKGAISIMFSGTAAGEILLVYVVYKSESIYSEWIQGGPRDTRYNHTKSGWFDSRCFEDYFKRIVLDWASGLPGKKVVICDNLSSHLSVDVIELCESHDIHFVFLPANSTHLTQPLDVAFFGPLKKLWRITLLRYKIENPNQTTLNKNHFPKLLKSLIEQIQLTELKNIKSGFKATGISPFNPREVLKRIPEYHEDLGSYTIDEALLDYLKQTRQPKPMTLRRNKKVITEPGKSVTVNDFLRQETNVLSSSVAKGGVKISKNYKLNTKKYQKSGKHQKLADSAENDRYEMDMIVDERMEHMERTENIILTDNINRDMTQSLKDIYEDRMELIERTGYGDRTDAIDFRKLSEDSLPDDVKEMNTFLDEKTGLFKNKGKPMDNRIMKLPGNKNNESEIKVLSSVTLNLPSTSTGKAGRAIKSGLFFRPHIPYSDSDEELQNVDKENVLEEIEVKIKNEKKERKCFNICKENYKDFETREELITTEEDENLLQKVQPIKTNKNQNKRGKNSKKQKKCSRLFRNSSGSETDESDNISYRESSDSETWYVPEDVENDVEIRTPEFNEYKKTKSDPVENEELLDHHIEHNVHVDTYVLVKFITKKSIKHYVGKVTKVNGIFVSINFLRKKKNNTFAWPQVKDEAEMYLFDIVKVLPQPIDNRRGLLKF